MSAYSGIEKLLHRVALQMPAVTEMSFDIDQKIAAVDRAGVAQGRHVFVSGLARAGTTVLMRRFHASGAFRSLTYRDMPFVLAPNMWKRMSGVSSKDIERHVRAHGDGVEVDADSPEALEEVFWRVFCGDDYLQKDRLVPHRVPDEVRDQFRGYVGAILAAQDEGGPRRYLSKNNNNILRIGALRKALPEALILVPFRDPVAHAASLMRQHELFCGMQADDPFVQKYMGWLAHHEFGLTHRPFCFGGTLPSAEGDTPATLAYWLRMWRDTYAYLLEQHRDKAVFVCYEDLCADPGVWSSLAGMAGLDPDAEAGDTLSLRPPKDAPEGLDPALLAECRDLYATLRTAGTEGMAARG